MEKEKPTVRLIGEDGNAFAIMGKVSNALRNSGYTKEEILEYQNQATSGDYKNLMRVTAAWVNID